MPTSSAHRTFQPLAGEGTVAGDVDLIDDLPLLEKHHPGTVLSNVVAGV